jgi:hypothetical protein
LYLDVKSDATADKVVLHQQATGDRSSQIWIIDSNGYLVNRAYPSKVVGTITNSWYYRYLELIDRPNDGVQLDSKAVTWDVKSLYEGFFAATSATTSGSVLSARGFWYENVTAGTHCILQDQNEKKNQLWSLQLAHEQK